MKCIKKDCTDDALGDSNYCAAHLPIDTKYVQNYESFIRDDNDDDEE